jgi:hypothetical protein
MSNKYIILSESNHYDWSCGNLKLNQVKKLLKQEDIVVYIFKLDSKTNKIKLHYPFSEYYDCLQINIYDDTDIIDELETHIEVTLSFDQDDNKIIWKNIT